MNYAVSRETLLMQIVEFLTKDSRFTAAWLTGSFGRGDARDDSDLDLNVVTIDETLLARPSLPPHQTTPERMTLIRQFGKPGILFEAHQNAPPGGTFTTVYYADTAVCLDWILLPVVAQRPLKSLLLFETTPISIQLPPTPESLAERKRLAEHDVAYFWLMTAVIVKYINRDEPLLFNSWLNTLYGVLDNVQRLVDGRPWQYRPEAYISLKLTREEQMTAVRRICQEMQTLMPLAAAIGCQLPIDPMPIVETRLSLAAISSNA